MEVRVKQKKKTKLIDIHKDLEGLSIGETKKKEGSEHQGRRGMGERGFVKVNNKWN